MRCRRSARLRETPPPRSSSPRTCARTAASAVAGRRRGGCRGAKRSAVVVRCPPEESQEGEILRDERLRRRDMASAPDESSPVHHDEEGSLGDCRFVGHAAADHPGGEKHLHNAQADKGGLREAPRHSRQVLDKAKLIGAASRHLAPETVVEPNPGDGRRRKSSTKLSWLSHRASLNSCSLTSAATLAQMPGEDARQESNLPANQHFFSAE